MYIYIYIERERETYREREIYIERDMYTTIALLVRARGDDADGLALEVGHLRRAPGDGMAPFDKTMVFNRAW